MKPPAKADVYEKIKKFQDMALTNKPAHEEMVNEVRFMNFKIRPVNGNIAALDFHNADLIDALWSLGKLDEFARTELSSIPKSQKDVFFRIVNDMRLIFQQRINKVRLAQGGTADAEPPFFEAEIFKDSLKHIH